MVKFCTGCNNRQCFVFDSHSDTIICTECRLVYDFGNVPPDDGTEPVFDPVHETPESKFKNTYHRVAHLNERLSSAVLHDPLPPDAVMDLIRTEWLKLQETNYFVKLRAKQGLCKKSDIRNILGSLDLNPEARKKLVEARVSVDNPNPNPDTGFSILYLEKWKHLGSWLTGKEPPIYDYHQVNRVGHLLDRFSSIWNRYQHPNDKFERKYWVFKDRKHFPNFNFMFQRVHELLGPEYTKFNPEFPVPTNGQALKRLWRYWRFIAKKANVPFRGKDEGQGYNSKDYKQTTFNTTNGTIKLVTPSS